MMSSTTLALSSTTSSSLINRPACFSSSVAFSSSFSACSNHNNSKLRRTGWVISCEVAVKSNNSTTSLELDNNPSASASASESPDEEAKIGSRIKVKVPLKVYHVPRVEEVDLTGMEGVLKKYVANWKGKRISANLPYKVEFVTQIEGRGPVKFVAHLKEDEFDYLD
ncbi:hypothetical protein JRO89_XS05G0267600 [Xanthoceras sorbifolium]|uniref:Ferredoxin thioredoxin reductase alpha chain domain-containing protein n=1 Tax=Xanthoceras sorbifolium TaxID=99658 RepID=A0ABQ8I3N0_9ROSI|nr:hypothetical protein JRO89_XS05G0267600 [Xanthoceras sorbifolium]